MRKTRVFVKIDGPLGGAMKRVTEIYDDAELESDETKADLVVVENLHSIGSIYNKDKWYVIVSIEGTKSKLPENVIDLKAPFELPEYYRFISEIAAKLDPEKESSKEEKKKAAKLIPDAKKILVVEDTPKHQNSAEVLLAGHDLKIVSGYEDAMKLLAEEKFEFVLSDLKLPMSPRTLSDKAFELGKLVDYGLLISLEAARAGAKYVAVATDLNHHADCFSAAFDHFSRCEFVINGAKVKYIHAPMINMEGEYVKDWKKILEVMTSGK